MTNLFNSGVRPAIDEWLLAEAKKKRDYGEYWSASSAGYCQRKLIFERLGVPYVETEDDARRQRVFTSGHLFHAWIQEITKKAGISLAQEGELQDEKLMVRGHFDDLVLIRHGIEGVGNLILYDYKTRNSKGFGYAKSPSHFHKMQLGTYMYMLRKTEIKAGGTEELTEARTLNIEKDTLRMAEVQYLWSDELEKEVVDYWTSLNKHWAERTLPPCSCGDHAGGFMAKERWNPYFYEGEPCSIKLYQAWKKEQK